MNKVKYDHRTIEPKWQAVWEKEQFYKAEDFSKKKKTYILIEFPYPSGERLHVGHARSYSAFDVIARKRRMQGENVLYPMGWDAFGLPAENYAVKTGIHPEITTKQNIENARKQAKSWGLSFDWSREVTTTDPSYYRWTQWIFLQLFKKGLAYRAEIPVNWCPSCKINLANEEVIDGNCERCGTQTSRRMQKQWLLKITKYAERLLDDLKTVDYRKDIKLQQVNWIGKKEGIDIKYQVSGVKYQVECFTTRPDTNFGATFIVLAPEHPLALKIADKEHHREVKKYIEKAKNKSELERIAEGRKKTGVFTGRYAINQLNNYKMPIWISDFVLMNVGTGALVGVPGHDKRDFEFAKEFNLEVKRVVVRKTSYSRSYLMGAEKITDKELRDIQVVIKEKKGKSRLLEISNSQLPEYKKLIKEKLTAGYWNEIVGNEVWFLFKEKNGKVQEFVLDEKNKNKIAKLCSKLNNDPLEKTSNIWLYLASNSWYEQMVVQEEEGVMINSDFLNGMDIHAATKKIMDYMVKKGWGGRAVSYHLRDWVFSRQHYWGEPIPVIYCSKCRENQKSKIKDQREGVDYTVIDGKEYAIIPVPEKELPVTLPHVDKFKPTETGESPLSVVDEWVNVRCPSCGGNAKRETDTMPNWAGSSWYFLRYIDPKNDKQLADYKKLKYWTPIDWYNGGLEHTTLHLLYSRFWHKFLFDIGIVPTPEPYAKRTSHGVVLGPDGSKMSKSRGNVVNPDDIVKNYGADTLRMYEMFMGPFEQMIAWDEGAMRGVRRFLDRVYNINSKFEERPARRQGGNPKSPPKRDPAMAGQIPNSKIRNLLNKLVKKVTEDIENLKFNTAISGMMEFLNEVSSIKPACQRLSAAMAGRYQVSREDFKTFLKILAPFAPHVTEELWQRLANSKPALPAGRQQTVNSNFNSIHKQSWPKFDTTLTIDEEIEIIIQVNGKLRGVLTANSKQSTVKEDVVKLAKGNKSVARYLQGKTIKSAIFVPGRLVNFVVE